MLIGSAVTDLIIRIKNGYMAKNKTVECPYSKYRGAVLEKLNNLGFIKSYSVHGDLKKTVTIELLYRGKFSAMTDVKIFSKPGRRIYSRSKDMSVVMGGFGYALISTSKGILTNFEAKKQNEGGELLFHIW